MEESGDGGNDATAKKPASAVVMDAPPLVIPIDKAVTEQSALDMISPRPEGSPKGERTAEVADGSQEEGKVAEIVAEEPRGAAEPSTQPKSSLSEGKEAEDSGPGGCGGGNGKKDEAAETAKGTETVVEKKDVGGKGGGGEEASAEEVEAKTTS